MKELQAVLDQLQTMKRDVLVTAERMKLDDLRSDVRRPDYLDGELSAFDSAIRAVEHQMMMWVHHG